MDDRAAALARHQAAKERVRRAEAAYQASFRWCNVPAAIGSRTLTWKRLPTWEAVEELEAAGAELAAAGAIVASGRSVTPRLLRPATSVRQDGQTDGRTASTQEGPPMQAQARVRLTFPLSPEAAEAIRARAEAEGTSMTAVVESLIRRHLLDQDDRPGGSGKR